MLYFVIIISGYKLAFNYLKAKNYIDAIDVCHKVSVDCSDVMWDFFFGPFNSSFLLVTGSGHPSQLP